MVMSNLYQMVGGGVCLLVSKVYQKVGGVWVGPDCISVFRQFLLTVHMVWPLGMNIVLR